MFRCNIFHCISNVRFKGENGQPENDEFVYENDELCYVYLFQFLTGDYEKYPMTK